MNHFGFKAKGTLASWLTQKSNRSKTIRKALRMMMLDELRQSAPDQQKNAYREPKACTHRRVTSRRSVSKSGGFMRGNSVPKRCAEAQLMKRRRGICLSGRES